MHPVEIKKDIYWVGAVDWDLKNFHGYLTQRGSSYNAYLIIDEKVTLVDTVKHYCFDEMIERISKIIDPKKIDYIVSNHVEMDHSGSLPKLMELIPNAEIFTSPNGKKGLIRHYKKEWKFNEVKTGTVLNIGKRNLSFVLTPMVHWPDSMATYIAEEKLLLPNDAFGQHISSDKKFDYEFDFDILMFEAQKYYANIVFPFGTIVSKVLEAVSGLDIDMIAPSHGIIWTKHINPDTAMENSKFKSSSQLSLTRSGLNNIIEKYKKWASNITDEKAVIVYDSMWESTAKVAQAIGKAFENKQISVKIMSLQKYHISDVMSEILEAKYICVGSPTLNNGMLPTVSSFLTYMKGLAPKNRKGLAFGSYGWGGQSVGQIKEVLDECGFEELIEPVKVNYVPGQDELDEISDKVADVI